MIHVFILSSRNPTPMNTSPNILPNMLNYVCVKLFIARSGVIRKDWKQPKCLSIESRVDKLSYIHTTVHYAAVKKNEDNLNPQSLVLTTVSATTCVHREHIIS